MLVPVPLSVTVCGLPLALSYMDSDEAGAAPVVVGLKVSMTVQLPPADTVGFRHVDDAPMEYGVPAVTDREEMDREVDWLFVNVMVSGVLLVPTATLLKFQLVGETATGAMPVPVSATVCWLAPPAKLMVILPDCAPSAVGSNLTASMQ
jgi:hypothetical protein